MTTRLLRFVCLFATALIFTGCNSEPTHDSVTADSADTMEELVTVMKSIKDESSAEAAKPKLKELSAKFRELQAQEKKLGEPTKEKREELKKKYEERILKLMKEMLAENLRIRSDPKLRVALDAVQLDPAPSP